MNAARVTFALVLGLLATPAAIAAPGFFRPIEREPAAAVMGHEAAGNLPCGLEARFNPLAPTAIELHFLGAYTRDGGCTPTALAAASAAYVAAKVAGEPANPPAYICSVTVQWEPAAPSAPTVSSPAELARACDPYRPQALHAIYQGILCWTSNGSCVLPATGS